MSSEERIDDATRNAILQEVLNKSKPKQEDVHAASSASSKVTELTSFGDLLEQSVNKRLDMDKEDNKESDTIREKVIKNSRIDLIGQLKF